ncbi:Stk1 family PASTA domain-containing Ser/Thr kinase [Bifidobacterium gallicum]|uniref:non-specific serine/threonine protein kinase n=1 Tax=Bifidobacterium gallicum DSM 20093 = LMG 11596 TaxID=561180 RepID=D1NW66_9BIFI|nr:Stk1 family PASTA domain-containing Ser/Thr kinase [Bifidobacterium gallicum]EFA22352.1 kinase domain protein [Bifidobacterium gallicum DSM 20093 = LMG 11596]KFI60065.1 serine/threonine protein kinase [Bifidobacterium gallicum DSM 20093 = LMG 11596]
MSSYMPSSLDHGRYQLGQLIGRGGMAEVYIATDTRLGRTVAIKIMRADLSHDEIFLTRFRREAHSVAQMNNPNIVNIYDSGEESVALENGQTEHLPYLVMEYVKGQTLRDILRVNGALSQGDAEHVMLGVLSALEYSHRMGIIHRDIKPGNIMISEQGVVKVMDFGIARALDDSATTMTQSQGVVGTAQYLSPEQARGESVDMRSDLYSAGCVLYEMLTGKPPFTGDSAVAIAYQHVSEVATPPSVTVPGLPKMWDSIVGKAMAKDRQNRYATATEFKNDILRFMNGGMPIAAAFNPLTDLTNMKARRQAEQTAATMPYGYGTGTQSPATQAFNPVTGQFEPVPSAQNTSTGTGTAVQSRAAQRAAAAKKRKKRNTIIAISVIAVIAILAAIGFGVWKNQHPAIEMVKVPTFNTATTEDRAVEQLKAAGLVPEVLEDNDSTEPAGTFTKQNPQGGTSVAKGSKVRIYFSTGPQSIRVPDVTNLTQEAARTELENAGFVVNPSVQIEDSGTIEKDHVTRTDPAGGTSQPKGTSIQLYISSGTTRIPDGLVGMAKNDAVRQLQQAGLTATIEYETSDTVEKDHVVRVDPDSGTSVTRGSGVTLYISQGVEKVTVPYLDLSGTTTLSDARVALQAVGLNVEVESGPNDDAAIVTSMNPAANSEVDKGSTVKLQTKDAPSPSPSPSDSSSPTSSPSPTQH